MQLKIERYWAMPNHKTFTIAPLKKLINEELGESYIDPFPYPFKQDAIKYLKTIPTNSVRYCVFDPPYSSYQLKTKYENAGLSLNNKYDASYWSNCKKEISMTHEATITAAHEMFNCGTVRPRAAASHQNLPQWRWRCCHRDALQCARRLVPYSITKKEKLESIIKHYAVKDRKILGDAKP